MKTHALYEGPVWFNGCKVNNHFTTIVVAHTTYWAKHEIFHEYRVTHGYTDSRGRLEIDESLLDFVDF